MRPPAPVSSLFHSPERLVVGDAPLVGVLDLPGTRRRPPVRLYFPADAEADAAGAKREPPPPARYFVDGRVAYVLQGYAHVALARHTTRFHRWILRPLAWLLSLAFPARFLRVPGTAHVRGGDGSGSGVRYLPPAPPTSASASGAGRPPPPQSLVVFSHGLTGTGEENSVFCASLAKRGHVVAALHHRDGSSCRVPMPDGTCRYYEHMPTGNDYDPKFRLEQVHARAREFLHTCDWLTGVGDDDVEGDDGRQHPIVKQIRPHLEAQKVVAAGFSYGSATAALAATLEPSKFRCALMLDAWLHIDYRSRGFEFDFPPEAFGKGWPVTVCGPDVAEADANGRMGGLGTPSLFLNSAQFQSYEKLYGATKRLAEQINAKGDGERDHRTKMHVIPGTKHQNFCDVIFWVPRRMARKLFQLGKADPYEAYEEILHRTIHFMNGFSSETGQN
ncbi:hypothetical protein ACHAWF_014181 [Thalassiosira exigua]